MVEAPCELTILMPCLNEAQTLETCIRKAQVFLESHSIKGEILIADNGSTDGSIEIAQRCGARLVHVNEKGYGAALIGGCNAASGTYIIMGDADDSYDFSALMPFVERLRQGYDLVMGNRFKGGIEKGAMPPLHQYIGNPVLSFLGRLIYHSDIRDFHCGLRGFKKEAIQLLRLQTTGMEYASEMVVQATLNHLKITEVPTKLYPDGRNRPPHLRSWHDGWRHLKFLLLHSPNWLFLFPGCLFLAAGLLLTILLVLGPVVIHGISFDIHTLLYTSSMMVIGLNILFFGVFTKVYAVHTKFIPPDRRIALLERITLEKSIVVGILLLLFGCGATLCAFLIWKSTSFGILDPKEVMRITIPALSCIIMGLQCIFSGFFLGILNIPIQPELIVQLQTQREETKV